MTTAIPITDTGRPKSPATPQGRAVDPGALKEVARPSGRTRAGAIFRSHTRIASRTGHVSAAQLVALADELKLAMPDVCDMAAFCHHFDVVRENDAVPSALTVRVSGGGDAVPIAGYGGAQAPADNPGQAVRCRGGKLRHAARPVQASIDRKESE